MSKKAVLLANLGSPDSFDVADVRNYLDEFLMDVNVIDAPLLLRTLIVRGFILPSRPKFSAEAYKKIWTDDGSPLIVSSNKVKDKLINHIGLPIELGMRYGNPSIGSAIKNLKKDNPGLQQILLVPLYPHYARSSFGTVVDKVRSELSNLYPDVKLYILSNFYNNKLYINALSESIKPFIEDGYEHILFSYHGLPERHLRKTDPTKKHCLKVENCCIVESPAHQYCYRHQVFETTRLTIEALGISREKYSISFQSRLGWDKWLDPNTEAQLQKLANTGVKKLLVVCPAFVSDCLETLEEIEIRGKEDFLSAGGEELILIPCLNDNQIWIETLANWINNYHWQVLQQV